MNVSQASSNFTARDLGLLRGYDPKSLDFPLADVVSSSALKEAKKIVTNAVRTSNDGTPVVQRSTVVGRRDIYLSRPRWDADQGDTPRCTGFSGVKAWLAHKLTTKAYVDAALKRLGVTTLDALADLLYVTAVQIDRNVHGWVFDGGATMLALGKAGVQLRLWSSYHWGSSAEDAVAALLEGFVPVLGIWWKTGMDTPIGPKAYITYTGTTRGGHAICMDGLDAELPQDAGRLDQTWGEDKYGIKGHARFPMTELNACLADDGEVLIVQLAP